MSKPLATKVRLSLVKHSGGSVMVWGCMSAAGTGELQFIEGTMNANIYCDILKLGAGSPPSGDWAAGHYSKHDNDHCLAKEAEGKVMTGQACLQT